MTQNGWFKDFYAKPFAKTTYSNANLAFKQLGLLKDITGFLDPETKIFDQCCGDGTFACMVASNTDVNRILGIDLSEHFIEEAKTKGQLFQNLEFKTVDALSYVEENTFDIATCWKNSCSYSFDDNENLKQLDCMSRSLKNGGLFVIDTLNIEFIANHFVDRMSCIEDDGTIIARLYQLDANVLSSSWKVITPDDKISKYSGATKLYSIDEWKQRLKKVGLQLVGAFGDYDGMPVSSELGRLILHGVKCK